MKCFFLLGFLLLFSNPIFAEEGDVSKEQASVAVNIFKKACFFNQNQEKRIQFLDSKFPRHDGEKAKLFLNFTASKEGTVWAVVFSKGVFVVVVEDNHNCHVLARQADEDTIHGMIKSLSEQAKKNLMGTSIEYNDLISGVMDSSGFTIKSSSGENIAIIAASTKDNPPADKLAAIITMVVTAQ